MAKTTAKPPRWTVSETPEGARVIIPAPRSWVLVIFLGLWLISWALGEAFAAIALVSARPDTGTLLFTLAWLTFWTIFGGFALYAWLRQLFGREVVLASSQRLVLRNEVLGRGRSREFDPAQIRNLRSAPPAYNLGSFWLSLTFWGPSRGSVAFDYDGRTQRFGVGLDQETARQLLRTIQTHLNPRERRGRPDRRKS